jgi:hypothetical protein
VTHTKLICCLEVTRRHHVACETRVGASLLVIAKNDGGIRPIAVGYVWRLLTAKVARSYIKVASAALRAPRKLGFAETRGLKTAVRGSEQQAARCYVDNMQQSQLFLKIDSKNAFNALRRDSVLEVVTI